MAHVLSQSQAGFGFFNVFSNVIESFRAARARREVYTQTYNELSSLSDRDLADIGVNRASIDQIAKEHAQSV